MLLACLWVGIQALGITTRGGMVPQTRACARAVGLLHAVANARASLQRHLVTSLRALIRVDSNTRRVCHLHGKLRALVRAHGDGF